jgi:hypothetical protein
MAHRFSLLAGEDLATGLEFSLGLENSVLRRVAAKICEAE